MIRRVNEHWTTELPALEKLQIAKEQWSGLSAEERAAVQTILQEIEANGASSTIQVAADLDYEEIPVPPHVWIEDPHFMGETGRAMFPKVKEAFLEIFTSNVREVILTGATRWGKDFLATTCMCRIVYELLCLRNPQESFGLAPGEPIHIVPLSVTQALAKRIVFGGIAQKLLLSPWFRQRGYEETKEEIRFPKNITLVGGSSSDSNVLGMNLVSAILDELNFHKGAAPRGVDPGRVYDKAESIYRAIVRRVKGTFGRTGFMPGKIFLISSKGTEHDFTERRIREAINDPYVLVKDYSLWDVHEDKFSKERFRVGIGDDDNRPRIIAADDAPKPGERYIEVPEDFRPDFEKDIYLALRDIAGISTVAVEPFFHDHERLQETVNASREHPALHFEWDSVSPLRFLWAKLLRKNAVGEMEPRCCPFAHRHAHIDPSTKRDATGICVAHVGEWKTISRTDPETGVVITEELPLYHVDFALRIVPPLGGEIQYANVRGLIYEMIKQGLPITSASMDSYQSAASLQHFERQGLKAGIVSVDDRGHKAYTVLKTAIYEGRLEMPPYEQLLEELRRLEYDSEKQKVDHPRSGRKDVADALAGAVFSLSQSAVAGIATLMMGLSEAASPTDGVWSPEGDYLWPDEIDDSGGVGDGLPIFFG